MSNNTDNMRHTSGFIFGVLYTEDGTHEGKRLGFRIVLTDSNGDGARVIVHNDNSAGDVEGMMFGSLEWAKGKYPRYVPDTVRLRKGPMPLHPDEEPKTPGKRRVVLELAIEFDPNASDLCDVEDLLHNVLVENDRVRRAGIDVQGLTGPR